MNKTGHVAASAAGLIGQTPVVDVKDRAARAIIEAARAAAIPHLERARPGGSVSDPLTPGIGATADAKCLAISDSPVILKIPVLPISLDHILLNISPQSRRHSQL